MFTPKLGARVLVRHQAAGGQETREPATVLYVGPVKSAPQDRVYVGLEFDRPGLGRHDGSVAGERYFRASQPGSGVLVDRRKVTPGPSLLAALFGKYQPERLAELGLGAAPPSGEASGEEVVVGSTALNQEITLQFMGEARAAQRTGMLGRLRHVSLAGEGVTHLDAEGPRLAELCPRLETLDLRDNALCCWGQLAALLEQAPASLRQLVLSGNPLLSDCGCALFPGDFSPCPLSRHPSQSSEAAERPAREPVTSGLRVLVLNFVPGVWDRFFGFLSRGLLRLPLLEELHFSGTEAQGLRLPAEMPALPALHTLDLSRNRVDAWAGAVLPLLRALPSLRQLLLDGNRLPGPELVGESFPGLRQLALAENRLARVADLDALRELFPGLASASLARNPIQFAEYLDPERQQQQQQQHESSDPESLQPRAPRVREEEEAEFKEDAPMQRSSRELVDASLADTDEEALRLLTIALLPRALASLNRSQVGPAERVQALRYFLARVWGLEQDALEEQLLAQECGQREQQQDSLLERVANPELWAQELADRCAARHAHFPELARELCFAPPPPPRSVLGLFSRRADPPAAELSSSSAAGDGACDGGGRALARARARGGQLAGSLLGARLLLRAGGNTLAERSKALSPSLDVGKVRSLLLRTFRKEIAEAGDGFASEPRLFLGSSEEELPLEDDLQALSDLEPDPENTVLILELQK